MCIYIYMLFVLYMYIWQRPKGGGGVQGLSQRTKNINKQMASWSQESRLLWVVLQILLILRDHVCQLLPRIPPYLVGGGYPPPIHGKVTLK